ncbi:hypothetical protein KY309_02920 [Candidatus Woesearchaeota archaeon]|nr:hypothetical protein [Candidatus Woesearchaeota archaeon]
MTENGKRLFNAAIVTPYLYENLEDEGYARDYIEKQIERFGYDPQNLNGTKFLETDRFFVKLHTKQDHTHDKPDLVVIGSAGNSEHIVERMKPSGIIVARYSIFYGGPSDYTGNSPEEGGYSLDLPKSVALVKAMLTHNGVLESILERDEGRIRSALDDLNSKVSQPVLVTPFLAEALRR